MEGAISELELELGRTEEKMVSLGLLTTSSGVFFDFSAGALGGTMSVELSTCMKLSGQQSLTGNIIFIVQPHVCRCNTLSTVISGISDIQYQLF